MKYGKFTFGQVEALINILGKENVEGLLRDDLTVRFEGFIKEQSLFDRNGWAKQDGLMAATGSGHKGDSCACYDGFYTHIDNVIRTRLWHLNGSLGFSKSAMIDLESFIHQVQNLEAKIQKNSQIAYILNGLCLPIVIPKNLLASYECGIKPIIEELFKIFKSRNAEYYSDRNYWQSISGDLTILQHHTKQIELIKKMEEECVVGLFFPEALAQFSVQAAKEFVNVHLPEGFVLSGIDGLIASIMYLDILLPKDRNVWNLNLPGLGTNKNTYLSLRPSEEELRVVIDNDEATAFEFETQGLLYIG